MKTNEEKGKTSLSCYRTFLFSPFANFPLDPMFLFLFFPLASSSYTFCFFPIFSPFLINVHLSSLILPSSSSSLIQLYFPSLLSMLLMFYQKIPHFSYLFTRFWWSGAGCKAWLGGLIDSQYIHQLDEVCTAHVRRITWDGHDPERKDYVRNRVGQKRFLMEQESSKNIAYGRNRCRAHALSKITYATYVKQKKKITKNLYGTRKRKSWLYGKLTVKEAHIYKHRGDKIKS